MDFNRYPWQQNTTVFSMETQGLSFSTEKNVAFPRHKPFHLDLSIVITHVLPHYVTQERSYISVSTAIKDSFGRVTWLIMWPSTREKRIITAWSAANSLQERHHYENMPGHIEVWSDVYDPQSKLISHRQNILGLKLFQNDLPFLVNLWYKNLPAS